MTQTVLEEADAIINGARQAAYGHPAVNFGRIARLWSAILDVDVSAEQVALCMVALKLSRQVHKPSRDNIVDMAGYAGTLELIAEWNAQQAQYRHGVHPEREA